MKIKRYEANKTGIYTLCKLLDKQKDTSKQCDFIRNGKSKN